MKTIVIKDEKGRDIIIINDKSRIAFARFPDMSPKIKEFIISFYKNKIDEAIFYKEVTNEDIDRLRDFLDYKSESNEFCV